MIGALGPISALGVAVGSLSGSQFLHRTNQDGMFDSMCRRCFAIVATEKHEADLQEAEKNHTCDAWLHERRQRRLQLRRISS
jgi:hypothetical protein